MAIVTVSVCDECAALGKGDPSVELTHWQVRGERGAVVSLDLCEEHAAPLVRLTSLKGVVSATRAPSSRDNYFESLTASMEELEGKKAEHQQGAGWERIDPAE